MTEHVFRVAPEWVSPPGETIDDLLEEKGWSQAELATRIGFTKKHLNELMAGKAAITPETATRLESTLGGTAAFWLSREAQYREPLLRCHAEVNLTSHADSLAEISVADIVRWSLIRTPPAVSMQVVECFRLFGVALVEAARHAYEKRLCAFRDSGKRRNNFPGLNELNSHTTWVNDADATN